MKKRKKTLWIIILLLLIILISLVLLIKCERKFPNNIWSYAAGNCGCIGKEIDTTPEGDNLATHYTCIGFAINPISR